MNKTAKLISSVLLCLSVGLVGSVFTVSAIPGWYANLKKPFFSPPDWIFGPVWTTLYLLMGVSLFLVWTKKGKKFKTAITFFGIQLFLNSLWSIIFFGLKSPGLALVEIIILWLAILATFIKFRQISQPASLLLFPYLLWVTFASILNFAVFQLN